VSTSTYRLLVVVAHPDDETFGCGSVIAEAAFRGVEVTVCCATRGEDGRAAPGRGIDRSELGAVREAELRAAAAVLGVREVEVLGLRDSGMSGAPPAGSLVATPIDDLAERLVERIDRLRPHVVLTLDGSDGHRDHVHLRDATVAATSTSRWQVPRVYLHGIPRSLLRRWADVVRERDPGSPYLDVDAAGLGTPDESITTKLDTTAHLEVRRRAIALHASQTSPFAGLPADLERAFLTADHLRRVVPTAPRGVPEGEPDGVSDADLFAGLDRGAVLDGTEPA
jgi:N-acetyl-1-D-myo-inositol-2-amino-2-deoxy-alpha-D-glucopyranoside deacetylase